MTMESAIAKEKTWQSTVTSAEKKTTSLKIVQRQKHKAIAIKFPAFKNKQGRKKRRPNKGNAKEKKDVEMTAAEENPKDVRSSDKEETAIINGALNPAQDN